MTQDSLFELSPKPLSVQAGARARRTLLPAPWYCTDAGTNAIGSCYAHPMGWTIEHCGHPTALYPYALYNPQGELVLAVNGMAHRSSYAAALMALSQGAAFTGLAS